MVIFWVLRRNWKSFLIWALLLIGLNGLTMAFYPTVAKGVGAVYQDPRADARGLTGRL